VRFGQHFCQNLDSANYASSSIFPNNGILTLLSISVNQPHNQKAEYILEYSVENLNFSVVEFTILGQRTPSLKSGHTKNRDVLERCT
jgi:hypothetical protein